MSRFLLASGFLVVGLVLTTPTDGVAQTSSTMAELHCMKCYNVPGMLGPFGPEDSHQFSDWDLPGADFWNYMDCHAFNACHTTFDQPGDCAQWHYNCQSGPHALNQVEKAWKEERWEDLRLLAATSEHIRRSDDHLLVLDCDLATIIGAFKQATSVAKSLGLDSDQSAYRGRLFRTASDWSPRLT